jgi:lactoylglutathione lyase
MDKYAYVRVLHQKLARSLTMDSNEKRGTKINQAVPFLAVNNIEESARYYVGGLGFEITDKWIEAGKLRWCWLLRDETALMLQEFPRDGLHSWEPESKVGVGVTIYFLCEDALAIYRELHSRGITASKPFVGNGMWVIELSDPDGYRLAFESHTDFAEGTEYSDDDLTASSEGR